MSFRWISRIGLCCFAATAQANAATLFYFRSDPGDYIGQGQTRIFTTDTGRFGTSSGPNLVSVSYNSFDGSSWWYLDFANRRGIQVTAGNYEEATRYPFQSPVRPGLSVIGEGRGCNRLTGRFIVWEAVYGPGGELISFAADLEQHCEGAVPALWGAIRINSDVPQPVLGPHAAAGRNRIASEGDTIVLDGSRSSDNDGTITDYAWQQVSGTAATLDCTQCVRATFVPPPVPLGGDDLVFELDVMDDSGRTSSDQVTIHVASQYDPQFVIHYVSDPGDYIGQGRIWHMTLDDGEFGSSRNFANGVSVNFNGDTWWNLDFAAPGRVQLEPGTTYLNAARFPFQRDDQPGLSVSGDGRGCNTLTGQFMVNDVVYAGDRIQSFAADFEQHCEGAQPALRGTVLFNFSAPP